MRKAELSPLKLLLLPLIPALALGIVDVASKITTPDQIVSIERDPGPPPNLAPIEHPPAPVLAPEPCAACAMSL